MKGRCIGRGRQATGTRCVVAAAQLAIVLLCALGQANAKNEYAKPVEISNSVFTFRTDDLGMFTAPNYCKEQVDRAAGFNSKKMQMVFTNGAHLTADSTCTGSPGSKCAVETFCYNSWYNHDGVPPHPADQANACWEWTQDVLDQLTLAYKTCFDYAAAKGFKTLAITHHLDDEGNGVGTQYRWRNYFVFDPLVKLGSWTYKEAVLEPLVNALNLAIKPDMEVWFSLQGEMGATLFSYPSSWATVTTWARKALKKGNVKVGLGFNHNQVLGGVPKPVKKGVKELVHSMDFIGLSAYSPVPVLVQPADLQNTVKSFVAEVGDIIDIKKFQPRGPQWEQKFLFYAEYGFGGGDGTGNRATAPSVIAANPQWTVSGYYWDGNDPWLLSANKAWINGVYATTAEWLTTGGGPDYYITGLFIWSIESFNVLGVGYFPPGPAYYSDDIATIVTNHNLAVN